jgi:hypothetical protein
MSTNTDLKACLILERLGAAIPRAQVEYERGGGMRRFVIVHDTINYDVGFPERLLEVCSAEEIDRAVRLFVERVRTGAGPRRIKIGTRSGDRRAAARAVGLSASTMAGPCRRRCPLQALVPGQSHS